MLVLLVAGAALGGRAYGGDLSDAWLASRVKELRTATELVGCGALVVVDGKMVAVAADGERKLGSGVAVSVNDKWHHGSITKSMTSTVIGKLVQQKKLDWQQTLAEMLPDQKLKMHETWRAVTLHQLLTHTAGAPANVSIVDSLRWPTTREEIHAARVEVVGRILAAPTAGEPGDQHSYSNVGYIIAGHVAATTAKMPWEALVQKELFAPMKLKSAGFGAPVDTGGKKPDQPWGHVFALFWRTAMDPKDRADNTPILGPAGTIHMTMQDLATYGWEHLQGELGKDGLLPAKLFRKLHEPAIKSYGYGWGTLEPEWAGGKMIWHNGSNNMWYSLLLLLPAKKTVMVFVTNEGSIEKADKAFTELAEKIAGQIGD